MGQGEMRKAAAIFMKLGLEAGGGCHGSAPREAAGLRRTPTGATAVHSWGADATGAGFATADAALATTS